MIHILLVVALLAGALPLAAAFDEAQDATSDDVVVTTKDFHGLAGVWVCVDRRNDHSQFPLHPSVLQISETGELVRSGSDFKTREWHTRYGDRWQINPETSPKELDTIREGAVLSPKVYELRDDYLIICSSRSEDVGRPKKVALGRLTAFVVYVRGLEKGRKVLAERLAQQYSGDWRISSAPKDADHWSGASKLAIIDGAFVLEVAGKERSYAFKLNPILEENIGAGERHYPSDDDHPHGRREAPLKEAVPLHIDLTMDGIVYQGVYEEAGPLRFSYFPDKPSDRPKSVGAEGAVLVELSRVTKP